MAIQKRELPPALAEVAVRSEAYLRRFVSLRPLKQFVAGDVYATWAEDIETGAELAITRNDLHLSLTATLGSTRRGKNLHHLFLHLPHYEYEQPTMVRQIETYRGKQPLRYLQPSEFQRASREILRVIGLFEDIEAAP